MATMYSNFPNGCIVFENFELIYCIKVFQMNIVNVFVNLELTYFRHISSVKCSYYFELRFCIQRFEMETEQY